MSRWLARLLIALALFLGAALAGAWVGRHALEPWIRARTESWFSTWTGTPVRFKRLGLAWGPGLAVEVRNLRCAEADTEPWLTIRRVRVAVALRALVLGRIRPGRIAAEGLRLRIERGPSGWRPAWAAARLGSLAGGEPEAGHGLAQALARMSEAFHAFLEVPPHPPELWLDDGQVEIVTGTRRPRDRALTLERIRLRFEPPWLLQRAKGDFQARLRLGGEEPAEIRLRIEPTRSGETRLRVAVTALDLKALPAAFALALPGALGLRGSAGMEVELRLPRRKPPRLHLRVESEPFELRFHPDGASAETLSAPQAELGLEAEITPGEVRIDRLRLALVGQGRLSFSGRIALPLATDPRVEGRLVGQGIDLGAVTRWRRAMRAPGASHAGSGLGRLLGGELKEIEVNLPGMGLAETLRRLSQPPARWPRGLGFEAEVVDVEAELGSGRTLSRISGRARVTRSSLRLRTRSGELDGVPLPHLELGIEGLDRLIEGIRSPRPLPAAGIPVRLPGLAALWKWERARHKPGGAPSWSQLRIEEGWARHPFLRQPLEGLRARIDRSPGRFRVTLEQARWGHTRFRGDAALETTDDRPVAIRASLAFEEATPAAAPADTSERPPVLSERGSDPQLASARRTPATGRAPKADPPAWGGAEVSARLARIGRFPARELRTRLRLVAAQARLDPTEVELAPSGRALGRLVLDLSRPDAVPFDSAFEVVDGSVQGLAQGLGRDPTQASGVMEAAFVIRGELVPGTPLLSEATGAISLHARDGEIHRRLPLAYAVVSASETLNPFRSRDSLPYRAIDAELRLAPGGRLAIKSFALHGPTLRAVATGEVNVAHAPNRLKAVVGIFMFRKLDTVIGKLPILNRLLLGKDQSLVGLYLAVTGSWDDPKARLIPIKSLAEGPASLVVEGLPNFVRGSLGRLESLAQVLVLGGRRQKESSP